MIRSSDVVLRDVDLIILKVIGKNLLCQPEICKRLHRLGYAREGGIEGKTQRQRTYDSILNNAKLSV